MQEKAKTVINELLSHICPEARLSLDEKENGRLFFKIDNVSGADLIGPNGETLRALTYVVRKILEKEHKREELSGFLIDVGGFVERKISSLKEVAFLLGKRAEDFKRDVSMEPMSSFERFVIHSFFENHPSLRTESRGFGKGRHVIIRYAPNSSPQEEII